MRVINTSARCPSLGDCYNAAIAFATGDVFAPWGATSINLPWRLEHSVRELGDRDVFRPAQCWYMLDGELDSRSSVSQTVDKWRCSRERRCALWAGFPRSRCACTAPWTPHSINGSLTGAHRRSTRRCPRPIGSPSCAEDRPMLATRETHFWIRGRQMGNCR